MYGCCKSPADGTLYSGAHLDDCKPFQPIVVHNQILEDRCGCAGHRGQDCACPVAFARYSCHWVQQTGPKVLDEWLMHACVLFRALHQDPVSLQQQAQFKYWSVSD